MKLIGGHPLDASITVDYEECERWEAEAIQQREQEAALLEMEEEQESEEEYGTPNAAYCQSMEPDHNGGWFCYHPTCVTSLEEG